MAYREDFSNGYSTEEVVLVETAKRTHRATTESAQRAASVRARLLGAGQNHVDSSPSAVLDPTRFLRRSCSSYAPLVFVLLLPLARGDNRVSRVKHYALQTDLCVAGVCVRGWVAIDIATNMLKFPVTRFHSASPLVFAHCGISCPSPIPRLCCTSKAILLYYHVLAISHLIDPWGWTYVLSLSCLFFFFFLHCTAWGRAITWSWLQYVSNNALSLDMPSTHALRASEIWYLSSLTSFFLLSVHIPPPPPPPPPHRLLLFLFLLNLGRYHLVGSFLSNFPNMHTTSAESAHSFTLSTLLGAWLTRLQRRRRSSQPTPWMSSTGRARSSTGSTGTSRRCAPPPFPHPPQIPATSPSTQWPSPCNLSCMVLQALSCQPQMPPQRHACTP